ncbi:hypothetical protein BGZ60DRAFT_285847 [Tricladium varicosporioides]|nr:hypothetical protein BGZ60DRAFT_285847 [Hymenoscyphus varicosporioides]
MKAESWRICVIHFCTLQAVLAVVTSGLAIYNAQFVLGHDVEDPSYLVAHTSINLAVSSLLHTIPAAILFRTILARAFFPKPITPMYIVLTGYLIASLGLAGRYMARVSLSDPRHTYEDICYYVGSDIEGECYKVDSMYAGAFAVAVVLLVTDLIILLLLALGFKLASMYRMPSSRFLAVLLRGKQAIGNSKPSVQPEGDLPALLERPNGMAYDGQPYLSNKSELPAEVVQPPQQTLGRQVEGTFWEGGVQYRIVPVSS